MMAPPKALAAAAVSPSSTLSRMGFMGKNRERLGEYQSCEYSVPGTQYPVKTPGLISQIDQAVVLTTG
jgi:hypothetical protein